MRLFAHVVDQLAAGHQPDTDKLTATGYLMRTTAVYGNGKFGIADRDKVMGYDGLTGPFQAEMLTVFLIREFTLLLAEHCARQKGGQAAARLALPIRRYIGVGNSTGLGMAPFLVNHPCLIHSWIMAREVALSRALGSAPPATTSAGGFLFCWTGPATMSGNGLLMIQIRWPESPGWPQNWISSRPARRRGLCRNRTRLQMRFHGFRTHPKRHRK